MQVQATTLSDLLTVLHTTRHTCSLSRMNDAITMLCPVQHVLDIEDEKVAYLA
jgi:hypothetical protein